MILAVFSLCRRGFFLKFVFCGFDGDGTRTNLEMLWYISDNHIPGGVTSTNRLQ